MSETAASLSHGHVPALGLRLLSDDRLARKAAEGDGQAFTAIYERHHQALYRYCRAIVGNAEDAADALQSTMAAALRALPGERREIQLRPWLYKIAHNESISLLRKRQPQAQLEEAINVAAPAGADAVTRERLRQLVADLGELPDRQRAALLMRELAGLQYGEIGAALGSSSAAIKQTVYEARTALHEMADGREMSCESVRRSLSAQDRRMLRGRKLRAHLRACAGCREFHTAIDVRRRDLAAVAPPLPAVAATALLQGLMGGGHSGGVGGLAGLAGGGTGKALATSAVAKGVATVAVVATVGAGTAGLTGKLPGTHQHRAGQGAGAAGPGHLSAPAANPRGAIPPSAVSPNATGRGTSRGRRSAGARHRNEALLERRAKGRSVPGRNPRAVTHPRRASRTPHVLPPRVKPQRSRLPSPVKPHPGGARAGAGPGSGDSHANPSAPRGGFSSPPVRVPAP